MCLYFSLSALKQAVHLSVCLFVCHKQDPELEKLHADRIAALKVCFWLAHISRL